MLRQLFHENKQKNSKWQQVAYISKYMVAKACKPQIMKNDTLTVSDMNNTQTFAHLWIKN